MLPYDPVEESIKTDENFDVQSYVKTYLDQEESLDLYSDVLSQIDSDSIEIESKLLAKAEKLKRKRKAKANSTRQRDLARQHLFQKKKESQRLQCRKVRGKSILI